MIVKDSKICGGNPTIKGTRIPVSLILANIRDEVCFYDICHDYQITIKDIKDCIEFAIEMVQ